MGNEAIYSTDCEVSGLNNNILVCGNTGCGKTMSVTEPRLLETFNTSLIVTVTKRRIVEKYTPILRERGYVVEYMNFVDMEKSGVAFDPMQYIRNEADIRFLASSIVGANPRKQYSHADTFWDEMSSTLLQAEIAYTWDMLGSKATFSDVLDLNDKLEIKPVEPIQTTLDTLFCRFEISHPNSFALSCWKKFHSLPFRTASSVIGSLGADLSTMFTRNLRDMIAKRPSVDFEKFASRRSVLFLTSNPVNPSLNTFINIFYGQAFRSLFEYAEHQPGGRLPIPVHMVCDDFATGSRIQDFPELISIFCEKCISVTLLLQSESQLTDMYGQGAAKTIINNCDTYLYLGGMDIETVRSISIKANEPFEDILYMPVGEEIVLRRGEHPVHTKRYDILRDERYQKITAGYLSALENQRQTQTGRKSFSAHQKNENVYGITRREWDRSVLGRKLPSGENFFESELCTTN